MTTARSAATSRSRSAQDVVLGVSTLVFAWLLAGCGGAAGGSTGQTGTGGQKSTGGAATGGSGAATGGSSSAGGSPACPNMTTCGGDLVGTWTVTSSCLSVSGALQPSALGLGCSAAPVTGSLQVTGTWTAKSDGTFEDHTNTAGAAQFSLAAACLVLSSTPLACDQAANVMQNLGFADVSCSATADGGCSCSCTVQQTGGMGVVSTYPSASGTYTTSGTVVTTSADYETQYDYCVSGNTLTVTPRTTSPTTTGTVVLQKQ